MALFVYEPIKGWTQRGAERLAARRPKDVEAEARALDEAWERRVFGERFRVKVAGVRARRPTGIL